ncbi:hypothetical protein [Terrarubrum flagellatum]|uniref:hypothetical protein n=1 Tax=Terrirubrum flagellatum TaxID=2895980 RepID=UPI003144E102
MVMEVAKVATFFKDNVISVVAAFAALFYGYFEFINGQHNQEKVYIEQFAGAVEKYSFPPSCEAIDTKQKLYLQIAISAAARLRTDFDNRTFSEIIDRLSNRYSEFEAKCSVRRAMQTTTPVQVTALDVKAQALQRSNIQLQEIAAPAKAGAKWFTVVASLPKDEGPQARKLICGWIAQEPEFRTWRFQIYQTNLSKSTAVVVDGQLDYGQALQKAQLLRANPQFSRFFPDAFAQIDRDWASDTEKIDCAASAPG